MIIDTTSTWTVINTDAVDSDLPSTFVLEDSKTLQGVYKDSKQTQTVDASVSQANVTFSGSVYKDKMCLYQTRNDRTDQTGRMCVRSHKFLAANTIKGSFDANGILGLAPAKDDRSIVSKLFLEGDILAQKVGLNFEDPANANQVSLITLGYFDGSLIKNGADEGLNYYNNIRNDTWSLKVDSLSYGHISLDEGESHSLGREAIIDTSNTTI